MCLRASSSVLQSFVVDLEQTRPGGVGARRIPVAVERAVPAVGADVGDRHDVDVVGIERADQHAAFVARADDADAEPVVELRPVVEVLRAEARPPRPCRRRCRCPSGSRAAWCRRPRRSSACRSSFLQELSSSHVTVLGSVFKPRRHGGHGARRHGEGETVRQARLFSSTNLLSPSPCLRVFIYSACSVPPWLTNLFLARPAHAAGRKVLPGSHPFPPSDRRRCPLRQVSLQILRRN